MAKVARVSAALVASVSAPSSASTAARPARVRRPSAAPAAKQPPGGGRAAQHARVLTQAPPALFDDAWLRSLAWEASAPAELRAAALQGVAPFAAAWRQLPQVQAAGLHGVRSLGHDDVNTYIRHLARDLPARTRKLLRALQPALPEVGLTSRTARPRGSERQPAPAVAAATDAQATLAESHLNRWWREVQRDGLTATELIVLEAWLPRLAGTLSGEQVTRLWRHLLEAANTLLIAVPRTDRTLPLDELAWTTGLLFAPLVGMDTLRRGGAQGLQQRLLRGSDRTGLPRADWLARGPVELESLVRSTHTAFRFQAPLWNEPATRRLHALVEQMPRLVDQRGRLALHGDGPDLRDLLDTARVLTTAIGPPQSPLKIVPAGARSGGRRAAHAPPVRGPGNAGSKGRASAKGRTAGIARSAPAVCSRAAQLACLRCDWSDESDRLTVAWHAPRVQMELAVTGRLLLSGAWEFELVADGAPVPAPQAWECVCWNSDSDGDYLELQSDANGLRMERQVFLSRSENFAVLADAVRMPGVQRLEYRAALPMAEGVQTRGGPETRELRLCRPRPLARVFPLALPEQRVVSTAGSFAADGSHLRLQQVAGGAALFAPLVLDWEPSRQRSLADWRTLTVSAYGDVVPGDQAAGHRLRVGDQQWLIYRSLTEKPETRAVLGHHTCYETVIGGFPATGEVRQILAIE